MLKPFLGELVTACLGQDDPAAVAWLRVMIYDNPNGSDRAVMRASAHWQFADENLRTAIATKLGLVSGPEERWPVPGRIAQDYYSAMEYVGILLREETDYL